MNSKIANLLADNLSNKKIVAEMIMHICFDNEAVENKLIDLCLDKDTDFVTEETLLNHIDKIKLSCMKYMSNIIAVHNIKAIYIDNIASEAVIEFKAEVEAWFKDKESADKGDSWYSTRKEDETHKIKGTCMNTFTTRISFKDIDLD